MYDYMLPLWGFVFEYFLFMLIYVCLSVDYLSVFWASSLYQLILACLSCSLQILIIIRISFLEH